MVAHPHIVTKVIKLDISIIGRLEHLGERKDRSPHWLMREAIVRYLDKEGYNEQLKQETLVRWEEIQNGKVVSHQAMTKWLDTWRTNNEAKRPPCGS